MFPNIIISLISKFAPNLGLALGGPASYAVESLISSTLGVDMKSQDDLINKIKDDPTIIDKLVALDKDFNDVKNAREYGSREIGLYRLVRPIMAFMAMCAIFVDILFIEYIKDTTVKQVLVVMLVFLVWDIRQIYRFYFGQSDKDNLSDIFSKK
ncbi:MAG TPA: hypothetical protein VNF93_02460 [Buchnera sp. (in: enterobacteria)]|nr:hypothetical protein [Buchnera sp. (in: enterobacteria)]